jgi:hypothetical protein
MGNVITEAGGNNKPTPKDQVCWAPTTFSTSTYKEFDGFILSSFLVRHIL